MYCTMYVQYTFVYYVLYTRTPYIIPKYSAKSLPNLDILS